MLETLRAKPEHIKKTIALATTIALFSVIVLVWWTSFNARQKESEVRQNTLSPTEGIREVFRGVVSRVENGVSGLPVSYTVGKSSLGGGGATTTSSVATSTGWVTQTGSSSSNFDISGVVVIDPAKQNSSTTTKKR